MHKLHENQRKILEFLLDHPEGATLDELASHLGVTKTAAKEHLVRVEHLGLLTFKDTKGFIGRPRRRYMLSPDGHETFPKQYSWLSNVLLDHLAKDLGSEAVSRMMGDLGEQVADSLSARFQTTKSTPELLSEVTATLNELGYKAALKQSDLRKGAIIEATNCVYHVVAKNHPELCSFDIRFVQKATGQRNVKLESCIARGGHVCRFCIRNS